MNSEKARTSRPKARPRTDWEAVERDYRTGKFTLRELAAKYNVSHQSVDGHVKRKGWTQDLSDAIRQATNTRLTNDLVNKEADKNRQDVDKVVDVAAEVNVRVILSHRSRLASLNDAVETAKAKLLALGDTVADIREAATFVQAVGNLATATKTLIEQERKAHNLDDAPPGDEDKTRHMVQVKFV